MKVFMVTDMEGVAGIVSFTDQAYPTGKYYEAGKKLVTGEVNAAVEGLVAAGVDDVLVWDGHGAGALLFEELHPAARLLHGRMFNFTSVLREGLRDCDAGVMIGQHAMAGVATGNMNHTQNSQTIDYYKLNGRPIGEIGQFALFCGGFGIPLIFLSGDDAACAEAKDLIPNIGAVSVKQGVGRCAAISLPMGEARRRIREGITDAVKRQATQPVKPVQWPGPYVLEMRFFHTDDADARAAQPGATRIDAQTVSFVSAAVQDVVYR
jgi:D-amino peptidase